MKEFLLYNKSDFERGTLNGSTIVDNDIVTKMKEINNNNFENNIYTYWQEDITNDRYIDELDYSNDNDQIEIDIKKEETTETMQSAEHFVNLKTDLYDNNGAPTKTDFLSINLDWKIFNTPQEETITLTVSTERNSYQEIIISSQSQIDLKTHILNDTNHDIITESPEDSIGQISNHISNEMNDVELQFRLMEDKIHTRLVGSGYKSIWYENKFYGEINKLSITSNLNSTNLNAIVNKKIQINNIYIDGYQNDTFYISEVIDTGSTENIAEKMKISLSNNMDTLYLPYGANNIEVELHYGDSIDELSDQSITINYTSNVPGDLENDLEEMNVSARYYRIRLTAKNKYFKNALDHILLEYTDTSGLHRTYKQVEQHIINVDFDDVNIIEAETSNFPFKIYIPSNANGFKNVEVTRLKDGDKFADGIFGFKFDPWPDLDNYILIEVDYTGYNLNPYMSEDGLLIGYLDKNGNPQQLKTYTVKQNNKLLAYFI